MAKLSFDDSDGVWRTIGGKRIFIRTGESLSSAMKKSGKFKISNKRSEVKDERKSFSRDELKEKYGTDDTDLINAGKEKDDRVELKDEHANEYKQKLNEVQKNDAETYMQDQFKAFDKGDISGAELEQAKRDSGLSKAEIENARNYVNERATENYSRQTENKTGNTTSQPVPKGKDSNAIKDMIKVKDGTYLPIREGETEEEVIKAYNERQEKYRRNLEPEVSKNLRDPRRLWDQDLVDTYIEMNERGDFKDLPSEQRDKFTRNMKNMAGEPLYSPDRLKQARESGAEVLKSETTNDFMNNKLRQKAYQKYMKEHPASRISFEDFKDMMNYIK